MLAENVPIGKWCILGLNRERYHRRIAPGGARQHARTSSRHDALVCSGIQIDATITAAHAHRPNPTMVNWIAVHPVYAFPLDVHCAGAFLLEWVLLTVLLDVLLGFSLCPLCSGFSSGLSVSPRCIPNCRPVIDMASVTSSSDSAERIYLKLRSEFEVSWRTKTIKLCFTDASMTLHSAVGASRSCLG